MQFAHSNPTITANRFFNKRPVVCSVCCRRSTTSFTILHNHSSSSKVYTPFCYTLPSHYIFSVNVHQLAMNFCRGYISSIQKSNNSANFLLCPLIQSSRHVTTNSQTVHGRWQTNQYAVSPTHSSKLL